MAISRDRWHKRRAAGGVRRTKRERSSRPASDTNIGPKRIHLVRCRGGNIKHQGITRETCIVETMYNASNNGLVRTKTLVKNSDACEAHYALPLARKKSAKLTDEDARINKKQSKKAQAKYTERRKTAEVEPHLTEQFQGGHLACISSLPGQGKEPEFCLHKIRAEKAK
uniref:Small ribosomal subunit protein eS8 n=1 Tax=Toxocara canis TaxID=6265 RepID=A0A183TWW1_TOXCA